jgi:hypothetical protein
MSHALNCVATLAYWGYSTQDRGWRTLFRAVGVMVRIPGCPAMPGEPTLLTSGPGPH